MAGDIRRIFDFGDVVLTYEATSAFYNDIAIQAKKQKLISINNKNQHLIPSLALLWEYLSGADVLTSRACSYIFLELVKTDVMDREYALKQLLNLAKMSKCAKIILQTLGDLLIFLGKEKMDIKTVFTSIAQHPLIQFYGSQPMLINEILSCADRISNGEGFETILHPILFLLLSPEVDTAHKNISLRWLIEHVEKGEMELKYLWNIYKFMPPVATLNLIELFIKSATISNRLKDHLDYTILEIFTKFGHDETLDFGLGFSVLERHVLAMKPDVLELFSLQFSSILLRLPYDEWKSALKIVEHAWNHLCPLYANLFFASLVNLNSMINQLKTIGLNDEEFILMPKLIQSCLTVANTKMQKNIVCPFHQEDENGKVKNLLDALCRYSKSVSPFLRALLRLGHSANDQTLNLLSALLVVYRNDKEIARACCEAIVKIVTLEKVSVVLPAFIQAASRELMGGETTILEFIPKLALHHLCTPAILRFLLGLVNGQRTRQHGYRLMGVLFEKQPFIYRQIKILFEDVVTVTDEQLLLLKMELLLVVCKISGNQHEEELTTILTQMINKRSNANTEATIRSLTMAIEAVGELCRGEALDPDVTWRMLYGKFNKSEGLPLVALCDFGGLIGEICEEYEDLESTKILVIQFLWKLATSSKTAIECKTAALRALAKFDFRNLDSHLLGIGVPKVEEAMEEQKGLPGDVVMTMFDTMAEENYEAFSLLLSKLITLETDSLGRGAYYNAKLIATKQSAASSSLDEFCSTICSMFGQGGNRIMDDNVATTILLVFEPTMEISQRGGDVMRKSIISAGRYYLQTLEQLLKRVPFDETSDWKRSLIIPFGWIKFMERTYLALISSRKIELELAKGAMDHQQEADIAYMWARDKAVEILKTVWRQDADARANCCLALAALGLVMKEYANNHSINDHGVSSNMPYTDNRHWTIVAVETLLGLSAVDYVSASKDLLFESLDLTPTSSTISASRLGLSFFLSFVRDDINGFSNSDLHSEFGYRLRFYQPNEHSDLVAQFYHGLSLGFYYGESYRHGITISDQFDQSNFDNRFQNIGGWLGVTIQTVLMDDFTTTELLLNIILEKLEKSDLLIDREIAFYVTGQLITALYPDPNQFIRSELFSRMKKLFENDRMWPGFLRKFCATYDKDELRRSISKNLNQLNDGNLLEKKSNFDWLSSMCGADSFLLTYIGRVKKFDNDDRAILNDLYKAIKKIWTSKKIDEGEGEQEKFKTEFYFSLAMIAFSTKFGLVDSADSNLPGDYSYLDEKSILRNLIDFIFNGKMNEKRRRCLLDALVSIRAKLLPPLDWDRLINSMTMDEQMNFDERIVDLAIQERSRILLKRFAYPNFLQKLSLNAKTKLLVNLNILQGQISTYDLRRFLNFLLRLMEKSDREESDKIFGAALNGLRVTMKIEEADGKDQSININNRSILSDWCGGISRLLLVNSYNDSRLEVVQKFIDVTVELNEREIENLIKNLISSKSNRIWAFTIRSATLIRQCQRKGELKLEEVERLVEVYGNMQIELRPSALRILTHELALGMFEEKVRDDSILHLMNSILISCKKNDLKEEGGRNQVAAIFDVLLAFIAAWYKGAKCFPIYLLDGTKVGEEFNSKHDSIIVRSMFFADLASNFAQAICDGENNSKLIDKVIDWAFQLLPTVKEIGENQYGFLIGILQNCRSHEFYDRKLKDPQFLERILYCMDLEL